MYSIFLMVIFDFMTLSMKINLNLIYKHSKIGQIKGILEGLDQGVSWCVLGYPGVSWGNKTDPSGEYVLVLGSFRSRTTECLQRWRQYF